MPGVSHVTLKVLAGGTWYIGASVLILKAIALLAEAQRLRPGNHTWIAVAVAAGILAGMMRAEGMFTGNCHKNLARIDALPRPKVWQFFRPRFFLFLTLMIAAGTTLSHLAHGNYPFLIVVAILDMTIGTALFTSGREFWKARGRGNVLQGGTSR